MTGRADCELLVLIAPVAGADQPPAKLVIGSLGDEAQNEVCGSTLHLDDLLDPDALKSAPAEAGFWVWWGRIESVSYPEVHPGYDGVLGPGLYAGDEQDTHWDGRWYPAAIEDLERFGIPRTDHVQA